MDRPALSDLLTIVDALAQSPRSFVVQRTLRRVALAELDAAAAATLLKAHDERWGRAAATEVSPERRVEALSIGRLFDR